MTNSENLVGLRRLNLVAGVVCLAQAILMLVLSSDLSLPVFAGFLRDDPIRVQDAAASEKLFEIPIGPAVALFLLLAAIDHLVVAAPACPPLVRTQSRQRDQRGQVGGVLGKCVDHGGAHRSVRWYP